MDTTTTHHPFDPEYEGYAGRHVGNHQWRFDFPNGYGASVVCGPYTYGGPEGLWELAVVNHSGNNLLYDTPITDDVVGYLTEDEVSDLLGKIAALPPTT
jgi:hypothetical protein